MTEDRELLDRVIKLTDTTVALSNSAIRGNNENFKKMLFMVLAVCLSFTIIGSIAIYGYFFSNYDYYEAPVIENTNTNRNVNENTSQE